MFKFPLKFYFGKNFFWFRHFFFSFVICCRNKMASRLVKVSNDLMKVAVPALKTFWYYARVELTPPKLSDIPEIKNGISRLLRGYKTGAWKQLTVKQGTLNTLVAMECVFWFYIGEVIGKRHLIGYKLP